jgi:hypothetical protein
MYVAETCICLMYLCSGSAVSWKERGWTRRTKKMMTRGLTVHGGLRRMAVRMRAMLRMRAVEATRRGMISMPKAVMTRRPF